MTGNGDEPPQAGRPDSIARKSGAGKHRRRRRSRRRRWSSVAKPDAAGGEAARRAQKAPDETTRAAVASALAPSKAPGIQRPTNETASPSMGTTAATRPVADARAAEAPDPGPARIEPMAAPRTDERGGAVDVRRGRPHHGNERDGPPRYAALDLGTNNCRLLVAEPWHQSFRVVDAFSRIVRLGEGLSRSGRLSDAAQDRAIDALRVCHGKLQARGIVASRLVATEACRSAINGEDFLERVRREAGLDLEILTRETEARLAVAGCANLIDRTADGVLLFDIGGGSSELVWLDFSLGARRGGDPRHHIRAWASLPVGVVTLSERHGGVAVGRAVFEDMVEDVAGLLTEHADWTDLDAAIRPERWHMLGTSGTVTTLAGIHLGLPRYDRRRVDGTWLADTEVERMIDRLLDMDFEDRVANPCIGGDRADLVLAGCAILEAIRRRWRCDRLRVADRGLREGMLTELMIGDGVWRRGHRWPRRGGSNG